jgi:hypothetical protein
MTYSLRKLLIVAAIAPPLLAAACWGLNWYFREAQAGMDTMSWIGRGIAFAAATFLIVVVGGLLVCWRTG